MCYPNRLYLIRFNYLRIVFLLRCRSEVWFTLFIIIIIIIIISIIIIIIIIVFIADLCFVWFILSSVYYFTKALYHSVWSSGTFLMSFAYRNSGLEYVNHWTILAVRTICSCKKKEVISKNNSPKPTVSQLSVGQRSTH